MKQISLFIILRLLAAQWDLELQQRPILSARRARWGGGLILSARRAQLGVLEMLDGTPRQATVGHDELAALDFLVQVDDLLVNCAAEAKLGQREGQRGS